MVHNGQVDEKYLNGIDKKKLNGETDSEALLHKYLESDEKKILLEVHGSYSLAIASKKERSVIILRDKTGIKPCSLGWKDGKYVIASEDIAFHKNGANFIEDIKPGCVCYIYPEGNCSYKRIVKSNEKHCFFEYNYIADIGSILDGVSVRRIRELLGEELAEEFSIKADLVTFLPRCPEVAARKFAEKLKIEFADVFYKTRDERSFLGSTPEDRKNSISNNLFLLSKINGRDPKEAIDGKTVVIIDDSTIRGNNSRRAIKLLKENCSPKKIYLINYTPKIGIVPKDGIPRGCTYGVDMPPNDDFIARDKTDVEISKSIGAEVLFLSVDGMLKVFEKLGIPRDNLCYFCIGGEKPF